MNKQCEIVRDLMPAVIDQTASESSQKLVAEHVQTCGECNDVWEEMRQETPMEPTAEETAIFDEAVKRLTRKKRRRKYLRNALLAILTVIVVLLGAALRLQWLYANDQLGYMNPNDYRAAVYRLPDGNLICVVDKLKHPGRSGGSSVQLCTVDMEGRVDVVVTDHFVPKNNNPRTILICELYVKWSEEESAFYCKILGADETAPVKWIYTGKPYSDDSLLLWQEDDPLPPLASEELCDYWRKYQGYQYVIKGDEAIPQLAGLEVSVPELQ